MQGRPLPEDRVELASGFNWPDAWALLSRPIAGYSRLNRPTEAEVEEDEANEWVTALRQPTLDNAVAAQMPQAYQVNRHAPLFDSLQGTMVHPAPYQGLQTPE